MENSAIDIPAIRQQHFGYVDGKEVFLFILNNHYGDEVAITNYGGTITSWTAPDKNRKRSNIVLGYETLEDYLKEPCFLGRTVGRYCNRIANGQFTLDGQTYPLAINNGPNHLHGGLKGFDKVVWDADIENENTASLVLHYTSKDGEEGYPGNLDVTVRYTLKENHALEIKYKAYTDKPTIVALTNHSYFNLTGDPGNTILDQHLYINAGHYTPVDNTNIPTGEIAPVHNTPFDFTKARRISDYVQQAPGWYDHNWVLNERRPERDPVISLYDPISGRTMIVYTTEPGIQVYTGHYLDRPFTASNGRSFAKHTGICLETQRFPDSPNKPQFPSPVLRPGEIWTSQTIYQLATEPLFHDQ